MLLPVFSIRTLFDPCGLWHETQSSFPSRTGMWPDFLTFIASCLWQVSQVSTAVAVFSWNRSDFGACTLWQVAHETLRASCMLPGQSACAPFAWHDRQVAFASRALRALNVRMSSFFPESTCFCP